MQQIIHSLFSQGGSSCLARCLVVSSLAMLISFNAQAENNSLNVVPNPEYAGVDGGQIGSVTGTVPDLWRAFAVGGGDVAIETMTLAPNTLFPGSPATTAVKLEVKAFGTDQGFDHENALFPITPGHDYSADVYLRSANGDSSLQDVSIAFPVFDSSGFTGRQPGSFTASAGNKWAKFSGPSFQEAMGTVAGVAFRLTSGGSENAVWIAMPTVNGPPSTVDDLSYPPVFTAGRKFSETDRYVSTSMFHWYSIVAGQKTGPWLPLEGRDAWNGEASFWWEQIKDVMDANIDVMYVHLFNGFDRQREELFKALYQLRREGYDTPYVVPFLDPLIIWNGNPIDLATPAGKDAFSGEYGRWFEQYFRNNPDPFAESRLLHVDDRIALNTWHCNAGFTDNIASLTRNDLESRLAAEFGADYPGFQNGIYQIATTNGQPPVFADEIAHQFSNTQYFSTNRYKGKRSATMKAGYWDQNVRTPGIFLPRNGGTDYRQAWVDLNNAKTGSAGTLPIYHAYVESWNEYDEGTGIYSGSTSAPFIAPENNAGNNDQWSKTNNPREYIDTTNAGAAEFNDVPALDSLFLWSDFPESMPVGSTATVRVLVRNTGDMKWTGSGGIQLGLSDMDAVAWGEGRFVLDDMANEVSKYGGVFRGRPVLFEFTITAPVRPGKYTLDYKMLQRKQASDNWFGDNLEISIDVCTSAGTDCSQPNRFFSFDNDGRDDVLLRHRDGGHWHLNFMNFLTPLPKSGSTALTRNLDWQMMAGGDFNGDGLGDVLLRNKNTGAWFMYAMNGRKRSGGTSQMFKDQRWVFAGAHDFDGDGKDDILLRHLVSGKWRINFMNYRTVRPNSGSVPIFANLDWVMMGTGDFNGDGRGDVLLRHKKTGTWGMFQMNGRNKVSGVPAITKDLDWEIQGIADFNGDGKDDVLLRHRESGRWRIIFLSSFKVLKNSGPTSIFANQDWVMMGTGDFNRDGQGDVLLRHRNSGGWWTFFMKGRVGPNGKSNITKNKLWEIPNME